MIPGAEIWNPEDVAAAIAFERGISHSAGFLEALLSGATEGPRGMERRSDAPFALARAAELAFATDKIDLALDVCAEIVAIPPATSTELALVLSAGALTGSITVLALRPNGILFTTAPGLPLRASRPEENLRLWPWPISSRDAVALARRVIPAAMMNGSLDQILRLDGYEAQRAHGLSPPALVAIKTSYEYQLARLLTPDAADVQQSWRSVLALDLEHGRRLDLLRAAPGWETLYLEGSIIDWTLLMFWAAIAVRTPADTEPPIGPEDLPLTPDGRSLQDLGYRVGQAGRRRGFEPVA